MQKRTTPQGILFLASEQSFMTDIARISVLRRALLNGAKAGIDAWLILTYSDPEIVRAHLAGEARLLPIAYDIVNLDTTTPKTLRARLPQGEMIVLSCTALFDAQTLRALQDQSSPTLGVQPVTSALPDALHVHIREGHLAVPDASTSQATHAAVGLLRCGHPLLAQAIERAWDAMPHATDPLSPVLTELLVTAKAVNALDISPYLWLPLSHLSEDEIHQVETQLLQRLGRDGDSPIVRLVARRLSRMVTHKLIHTRIRPNHVTLASGAIGICGALFLAQPYMGWQVIGSLLFLLSTVIDGCDGELARLTFQESTFGAKLDVTMDNVVHGVLFPAIALGLYREQQHTVYLVLGALAMGGVFSLCGSFCPMSYTTDRLEHGKPDCMRVSLAVILLISSRFLRSFISCTGFYGRRLLALTHLPAPGWYCDVANPYNSATIICRAIDAWAIFCTSDKPQCCGAIDGPRKRSNR